MKNVAGHTYLLTGVALLIFSIQFERESGWYSGKKLDFHPSKPGSTIARVNYQKKDQN